ncbi:MAG TPA: D-alanyl-D-alanine carboxypeptidase/D-alanyl-D-alanine-endopeptidase [Candidatus Acidoferrales bacterium]|nr:D-alanyl-D-alanine carboxypeptidase/D-alanyl-D-alanine-endopeptidase [Candidatus Acidoferrales bacterium]
MRSLAGPVPKNAAGDAEVGKLRARVETLLGAAHSERGYWGILIANRDTGETLYSLNPDHFFTPASNAKIFTTSLAFATLGPDYRFRTTLESPGVLGTDGRLAGNLVLMGRGDPDLSNRRFPYDKKVEFDGAVDKVLAEMADAAAAKGLKEIDGDVVADDSYFPYDPYPAGWNVGDVFFRFGAPVSAIAFNDNTVSVYMRPGAGATDAPSITVDPAAAANTFGVELQTVTSNDKSGFAVVRQPETNFLLLRGAISPGHAPMRIDIAMPDPARTAAAELKSLLEARGVRVTGAARAQHGAPPVTTASGEPVLVPIDTSAMAGNITVLAEHLSQPLIEIVRATNKVSQNLHAELLLRTVGREKVGVGSTAAGLKAEKDFLKAAGVADGDVILSDGSGLARDDLVTPRAAVTLLEYIAKQPWGPAFLSTLPVAGVDGTLENRMKNSAATGFIEAKTGAADHARALSGYATTRGGDYLIFSIFVNNNSQHGTDATETLDAIATAMVDTLGPTAAPKRSK